MECCSFFFFSRESSQILGLRNALNLNPLSELQRHCVHIKFLLVEDLAFRIHREIYWLSLIDSDVDHLRLVSRFTLDNSSLFLLFLFLDLAPLLFSFRDHDTQNAEVFFLQIISKIELRLKFTSVQLDRIDCSGTFRRKCSA